MSKKKNQPTNVVTLVTVSPEESNKLLAKAGSFTKADVPNLVTAIEAQLAGLKGTVTETSEVTEDLDQFGKIQDIEDVHQLILARGYVVNKAARYNESIEAFKAISPMSKLPVFKIAGGTEQQAINTIENRFKKIVNKDLINKLEKTRSVLKNYLTEEQKLNADLADIGELLSNVVTK